MDPNDYYYKEGRIGKRQYNALKKHAQKHDEDHIEYMLVLMAHRTLAKAHKLALEECAQSGVK